MFDVCEDGCLGFKSERHETTEPAGLVLKRAQLAKMINPLFERLDVAVKHCACAAPTHAMPDAMHVEPFLGRFLAATDLVAHIGVKNFRAAASDRAEAVLAQ